jgi:MerR family transcriptional regulator, copper efflux regulator
VIAAFVALRAGSEALKQIRFFDRFAYENDSAQSGRRGGRLGFMLSNRLLASITIRSLYQKLSWCHIVLPRQPPEGRIDTGGAEHEAMNIGEVEAATGVSQRMIRHYEKLGLIPAPSRTQGRHRDYSASDVARLRLVGLARTVGLGMDAISDLLRLWTSVPGASPFEPQAIRERADVLARRAHALDELGVALDQLAVGVERGEPPPHPWAERVELGQDK